MKDIAHAASRRARRVAWLFAGTSLILGVVEPASAQESSDDAAAGQAAQSENVADADDNTSEATIVVSGSRITASGFTAPTPTTVIGEEQIQQAAQPNVFEAIAQLPTLQGSAGTTNRVQNGNTSFGNNGISSLNMRGLGAIRTLTLIDGQRVVPAYITGIADVSQFPQLLIQRVDVVTGGASASWGSDAVAGVVNFITDTRFKGFKGNAQYGISTYGDDQSVLLQGAAGFTWADDRLHLQIAAEYFDNDGVPSSDVGGGQPNGRPTAYRSGNTSYALGAQPAGAPQLYFWPYDAQTQTLGRQGLITAGPLRGTAFDVNGIPYQFQYGNPCISQVCQGGQQDNFITTSTIDNPLERMVGYARIGFDITPDIEIYGTVNISQVKTENTPIAYPRKPANLTIQCSNAFLPASIVAACGTAGITSFQFGTANANLPHRELILSDREQMRFVVGSNGSFDIGATSVSFNAYYEHGENHADVALPFMTLNGRYNAAIDAINLGGQIVCRSAVARAEGCIPINIFTGALVSEAAFAWIAPAPGPFSKNVYKEDAAAISFNLTPFATWAGDVSLAFGVEYRREFYEATADPYGNGITPETPYTSEYPAIALINPGGNNWFAGNYHNGTGAFDVKEAFAELNLPLIDSDSAGTLNFNVAGRIADYSTAGEATTWKVGATYDTPLDGLRLRGVISRDLRAPNLSELFAAPQTASQNVTNRATGTNVQVLASTVGNPNLDPEIAKTYEIGAVYRPGFLPGLSMSFDYYDIRIDHAIAALTNQQIVDLCYNGNTAFCPNVKLTGVLGTADFPFVIIQPFNLASQKARGFDIEASYQANIDGLGRLVLRGLATHAIDYIQNTGIAGQQISQQAGNNTEGGAGVPRWKALLSQALTVGPVTVTLTERYISSGKINVDAIECQAPNCPVSTVQNPTINFNYIPDALYFDIGGSYEAREDTRLYFKVDNLFNHRAPPFGGSTLYDQLGRMFRVGVRFEI